jgi:hypothetical protein
VSGSAKYSYKQYRETSSASTMVKRAAREVPSLKGLTAKGTRVPRPSKKSEVLKAFAFETPSSYLYSSTVRTVAPVNYTLVNCKILVGQ